MIDGLKEATARASEAARVAQHQVHILSRSNDDLDYSIRVVERDFVEQNRALVGMMSIIQRAFGEIPGMSDDHPLYIEYIRVLNAYNESQVIDLTADDEDLE